LYIIQTGNLTFIIFIQTVTYVYSNALHVLNMTAIIRVHFGGLNVVKGNSTW